MNCSSRTSPTSGHGSAAGRRPRDDRARDEQWIASTDRSDADIYDEHQAAADERAEHRAEVDELRAERDAARDAVKTLEEWSRYDLDTI